MAFRTWITSVSAAAAVSVVLACSLGSLSAADGPLAEIERLRASGDFRKAREKVVEAMSAATESDQIRSLRKQRSELTALMTDYEQALAQIPLLTKVDSEGAAAKAQLAQCRPEAAVQALLHGLDKADPGLTDLIGEQLFSYKRKESFTPLLDRLIASANQAAPASLVKAAVATAAGASEAQLLSILDHAVKNPANAGLLAVIAANGGSPAVIREAWTRSEKAEPAAQKALLGYVLSQPLETVQTAVGSDPKAAMKSRLLPYVIATDAATKSWRNALFAGSGKGFIREDRQTGGSWRDVYGASGVLIANSPAKPADGIAIEVKAQGTYTWGMTQEPRGMQQVAGDERIASCWYEAGEMVVDVKPNGQDLYQLAVYFLDWDKNAGGRKATVDALDPATDQIIDTREVSDFDQGLWLVYRASGPFRLKAKNLAGGNTTIGGFLLDPAPASSTGAGLHTTWLPLWKEASTEAKTNLEVGVVAILYAGDKFTGASQGIPDVGQFGIPAIGNDTVRSVKVRPGYKVVLWESAINSGQSWVIEKDTPSLPPATTAFEVSKAVAK
ncbi:hypothetical protein LBMAG53_07200 [Planctomycetota bacterium]|nr:hypothetical protein LBMAG53_07200 [Planctomycetota bacterium]